MTDDMSDDGTPVVKVKHYKTALDPLIKGPPHLAESRGITFNRAEVPVGRQSMTETYTPMPVLKRVSALLT